MDDKVFVADNGPEVDRFTQARRGGDYLWDGSQWSFASAADVVFAPGIAPVNLRRYPSGSELFPEEFRDAFFLATSGGPAGIVMLPYDVGASVATGGPRHFVERRFEGPVNVGLGGLAFGPDGLYFTSILPNPDGDSPILKVVHRPTPEFPHIIGRTGRVIESRGCLACHTITGEGGQVGPELNFEEAGRRDEVLQRLESDSYAALQQQLDALTDPYYRSTREAREEVRVYITNKVLEPSFDRLNSAMPQLGLTKEDANVIANTLLGHSDGGLGAVIRRVALEMRDILPVPSDQRAGDMTAGAYAGFLGGILVTIAAMLFIRYLGPRVWARRPTWLRRG